MASLGACHASLQSPQVKGGSCLLAASAGPAPASQWPLQAQLIPHSGLPGPVLGSLLAAHPGSAHASRGLSRHRCCLLSSSPGPALPPSCTYRPTSCLASQQPLWTQSAPTQFVVEFVGLKSPAPALPEASLGAKLSDVGPQRPLWVQNFLTWAPPGPAPASQWPPSAQLLPPIRPLQARPLPPS
uniref:putative uncharacterized protein FLJ92257 n=1 Tax=Callithrix jacchus TaxID=9483 RepID=UPI0023DD2530|nr:putative uncharacterized protein FLJ92257 [Callithrix jacchus]